MDDSIGERIRSRRKALHMSMDELAEAVGYETKNRKTAIYQIESGKNRIRVERLPAMAKALRTNTFYLLGLTTVSDLTDEEIIEWIVGQTNALGEVHLK